MDKKTSFVNMPKCPRFFSDISDVIGTSEQVGGLTFGPPDISRSSYAIASAALNTTPARLYV